jgi:hypothetical protein
VAAKARRTIKTVTGAGGQGRDIYDQAIDPGRSTMDAARLIAERAEKAQIDFLISLGGIADGRQHDFAVNGLLADLRKRGIVNEGYQGTTLRENLGLPVETLSPATR